MIPAAPMLQSDFGLSRLPSVLPVTLYTLGLAFGPLCIAPLSEVFGRRPIYIITTLFHLAFTIGSAWAPSFPALLVLRFLAGFLGSAGMAMGAGSISDMWVLQKAGGTVGLFFILGPFLGPVLAPIAGSSIMTAHDDNWRWTQWLVAIIGTPIFLATLFTKETSHKHIQHDQDTAAKEIKLVRSIRQSLEKVRAGAFRAVKMLCTDLVVFSLALYTAYAYALTFSFFSGVSYIFPRYYDFTQTESYLALLSVMIGYILAVGLFACFDRTLYAKQRNKIQGSMPDPEHRLYSAMVGSVLLPVGLFWLVTSFSLFVLELAS